MLKFYRSAAATGPGSDEELLARYQADGDARYLGMLYERYMPMVYGVCVNILRDPAKAEDAVLDIYEELARKAKEHAVESFRGWLYVLARNHCLMAWRKHQRQPTDYHAPEDMVRYDVVEPAFDVELPAPEDKSLEKCLETLPEQQRQSVTLFYLEDKTYKEIAVLLAEEVGKIRSYIQNGRRNLKICLEKTNHTPQS